jgi:hypothetical protein
VTVEMRPGDIRHGNESPRKEKTMPKVSRDTASTRLAIPGYVDNCEEEIGRWTISMESSLTDMDLAPFYKGAPNDECQASHVGYVLKGKFGVRKADGAEEIFEAGDAFVIEPGHVPLMFAGCEYVAFTPTEESKSVEAVVMPNMMRYAKEQGIELPV